MSMGMYFHKIIFGCLNKKEVFGVDDGRFKRVVIITAKDNYFSAYSCNFLFSFNERDHFF